MLTSTIDLSKATPSQVVAWEDFIKIDRTILRVWMLLGILLISYSTKSGYIVLRQYDRKGIWLRTDYYLSFDLNECCPVKSSWVAQKINVDYAKE